MIKAMGTVASSIACRYARALPAAHFGRFAARSFLQSGKLLQQFPQTRSRLLAINAATGDIERQRLPSVDRQLLIGEQLIRFQKDEARGERCGVVAVDESVVPANVKEIRRRDLDRRGNEWLPYVLRAR